eukprot:CAMPEP_0201542096 /NCGR_PEP_ID=MMETSP0161_2-20130828/71840_1 /ASSEMBLY_ACC=CAM_ASM_000251 /TAXON_ID=180227 /ORGANISM="Neoparamoeba aestuarina, Strain SoJaBio B1-5/56/2" /LENGTH=131 /DNA_ID=CAMNT_0047949701 /DNA_START=1010 /DNA_END=1401 /DNA_ORIENTATION=+
MACHFQPVKPLDIQQMELTAMIRAREDTLYHLSNRISSDPGDVKMKDYLKVVRKLGREQFFDLALSLKILELQKEEKKKEKQQEEKEKQEKEKQLLFQQQQQQQHHHQEEIATFSVRGGEGEKETEGERVG